MNNSLFSLRVGVSLGAFALISLAAVPASAAQTAVSFDSSILEANPVDFSLGYSFTTGSNPLDVLSVGYLNDGAAGAAATHQVQLYQITGGTVTSPLSGTALLASAVSVTTSGSASSDNTFTYVPLNAPLVLAADTAYEIVATNNGNGFGRDAVNPVFSGMNYGTSTYMSSALLPIFNSNTYSANNAGNFGPNFQFQAQPVPEASTTVSLSLLLMLGLGSVFVAKRKSIKP